jgi:hypothetical protein
MTKKDELEHYLEKKRDLETRMEDGKTIMKE